MYTRQQFGQELKEKVSIKKSIVEIGHWAYTMYLEHIHEIDDPKFDEILLTLNTMELGPDFAFSYEELNKIADDLIQGKEIDLNADEYRSIED